MPLKRIRRARIIPKFVNPHTLNLYTKGLVNLNIWCIILKVRYFEDSLIRKSTEIVIPKVCSSGNTKQGLFFPKVLLTDSIKGLKSENEVWIVYNPIFKPVAACICDVISGFFSD